MLNKATMKVNKSDRQYDLIAQGSFIHSTEYCTIDSPMGSIGKPGNSLTLEGEYCAGAWQHKADVMTEYLAVSAVAFNWADSYDAKVHCSISRSMSVAH